MTARITPAEVIAACERIQELDGKATVGPWGVHHHPEKDCDCMGIGGVDFFHSSINTYNATPDAALIAELRNTGPALARALLLAVTAIRSQPNANWKIKSLAAIGAEFER